MKALLGLASMPQISFLETEPRLRRSSRLDSLAAGSRGAAGDQVIGAWRDGWGDWAIVDVG